MRDLFWLMDQQMGRLRPFFLRSHDKPRADDRRVLSAIDLRQPNELRWRDVVSAHGPHKTLYNRYERRVKQACSRE